MTLRQRRAALNALTGLRVMVARAHERVWIVADGDVDTLLRFEREQMRSTDFAPSGTGAGAAWQWARVYQTDKEARRAADRMRRLLGAKRP